MKFGAVCVSDRCSAGECEDRSGKLLEERTIDNKTELAKVLLEEFGVEYK